jgi:acetyl-CoA carboxylase biotin carboxyl carrier protein
MTVPIAGRTAAAAHRGWITGSSVERGRSMAEEIRAEMVANVWKIVVAEGDAVSVGDTVVILESMKMEIPVLVEVDGTIAKLAVSEGDVVQQGDLIAIVE